MESKETFIDTIKTYWILWLAVFILWFFLGGWMAWSLWPGDWHGAGRVVWVLFLLVFEAVGTGVYTEYILEKRNK